MDVSAACGVTRGCFLYPDGCSTEADCDYVIAYHFLAGEDKIQFHVVGGTDDYVAIGFSEDKRMVSTGKSCTTITEERRTACGAL